jgi:hypothetical protein
MNKKLMKYIKTFENLFSKLEELPSSNYNEPQKNINRAFDLLKEYLSVQGYGWIDLLSWESFAYEYFENKKSPKYTGDEIIKLVKSYKSFNIKKGTEFLIWHEMYKTNMLVTALSEVYFDPIHEIPAVDIKFDNGDEHYVLYDEIGKKWVVGEI